MPRNGDKMFSKIASIILMLIVLAGSTWILGSMVPYMHMDVMDIAMFIAMLPLFIYPIGAIVEIVRS
jgi:hypothetical protein